MQISTSKLVLIDVVFGAADPHEVLRETQDIVDVIRESGVTAAITTSNRVDKHVPVQLIRSLNDIVSGYHVPRPYVEFSPKFLERIENKTGIADPEKTLCITHYRPVARKLKSNGYDVCKLTRPWGEVVIKTAFSKEINTPRLSDHLSRFIGYLKDDLSF